MSLLIFILFSLVFVFNSCKSSPSSPGSERDSLTYSGKVYHTIKIGSQIWLKENLDVGAMIGAGNDPVNNGTIEKYCYNDLLVNCNLYGGLYKWNEAMAYSTTPGSRGICPEGWHIPTLDELQTLAMKANMSSNDLKAASAGTGYGSGTNNFGFSALLAGVKNNNGEFNELGVSANIWSSTQEFISIADNMWLYYRNNEIHFHETHKSYGLSVRCIKD